MRLPRITPRVSLRVENHPATSMPFQSRMTRQPACATPLQRRQCGLSQSRMEPALPSQFGRTRKAHDRSPYRTMLSH